MVEIIICIIIWSILFSCFFWLVIAFYLDFKELKKELKDKEIKKIFDK